MAKAIGEAKRGGARNQSKTAAGKDEAPPKGALADSARWPKPARAARFLATIRSMAVFRCSRRTTLEGAFDASWAAAFSK